LGEAQEGIAAAKRSGLHTRHIDKGVSLAIDYTAPCMNRLFGTHIPATALRADADRDAFSSTTTFAPIVRVEGRRDPAKRPTNHTRSASRSQTHLAGPLRHPTSGLPILRLLVSVESA